MKTYKEEIVTKKVVHQTVCNFCGQNAIYLLDDTIWSCEAKIKWVNNGPYPSSNGTGSFDVCQNCFKTILIPLMKLPLNEEIHEPIVTALAQLSSLNCTKMGELLKVYELEDDENKKLIVMACHYFCSEECQDKFLAPCERLWSQISPAWGEEEGKVCSCCGKALCP